jgi:pimeloyl-ACP methyl ester carboxylesterase
MAAVKERVLAFGEGRRLLGVLSVPEHQQSDAPAVLIPNTGLDHRVGPNRLHVQIARALAQLGHPVLRMDLSGMGDSLPAPGASDSVADQRAALDELARLGIARRFLVVGICSGGHDAHLLASADPRVTGAAFVDHYAFPTPTFVRRYWLDRIFDLRRLGNFLRRKFSGQGPDKSEIAFGPSALQYFSPPTREQFGSDVEGFVARNIALFYLYTGEVQSEYNYREQLTDGFPVLRDYPRLTLHFVPRSDHTFTRAFMREQLIALLGEWVRKAAS